jgi:hypothetical protein
MFPWKLIPINYREDVYRRFMQEKIKIKELAYIIKHSYKFCSDFSPANILEFKE